MKKIKYREWNEIKAELLQDPGRRRAYEELEPYYQVVSMMIGLRLRKKLTQKQLAELAGVTQAEVSRLESGQHNPNLSTLQKIAQATGTKLRIALVD